MDNTGAIKAMPQFLTVDRTEHNTLEYNFDLFMFFKDFIHLFMKDREWQRQGRGKSRLHAGSLMWDSIPRLQDHALS